MVKADGAVCSETAPIGSVFRVTNLPVTGSGAGDAATRTTAGQVGLGLLVLQPGLGGAQDHGGAAGQSQGAAGDVGFAVESLARV